MRNEQPELPAPIIMPKPEAVSVVRAPKPLAIVTPLVTSQDIQTGVTWADGQEVTAAQLNNTLNEATILPTFYSGKPSASPTLLDFVLFLDHATGDFKLATVDGVNVQVPVNANLFLAGAASGVGSSTPTFRAIKPKDVVFPSVVLSGNSVDWSLSNTFQKALAGNVTLTFSNDQEGQTIRILVFSQGHLITWPSIVWKGGSPPTLTVTAGRWDLITLTKISTSIFGDYALNFF